jgi:hypothetical protein
MECPALQAAAAACFLFLRSPTRGYENYGFQLVAQE